MEPEQPSLLEKAAVVPRVAFYFTAFTPREAEQITGASTVYQRELRKRGVLTQNDGHARFDLFGLASLMVKRMTSDRGGPGAASDMAQRAGFGIGWHVLRYYDSYSGDRDRILSWDPAAFPKIEAWQAATALIRHKSDWVEDVARAEVERVAASLDGLNGWGMQADWLRTEILRRRGLTHVPIPRYLCWWPTGTSAFQPSVDAAFNDGATGDPRLLGPVVTLDLERLAVLLLTRMKQATGKVFVQVEVGGACDG